MTTALSFAAGILLFLVGVEMMSQGLRHVAGERAKKLLARTTQNPVAGVLTGTVATTLLDSSSLVGIFTVGLVDAGMLDLAQGIGVVLGANIGTTVSSQLIAFEVGQFAAVPLAIGLLLSLTSKNDERRKAWARIVLGIGVLLFALDFLGDLAEPLREDPRVTGWMERLRDPLTGVLAGAVITAVLQSSSATVGMVVVLASRDAISIDAAVAVMLGAEIGTCLDVLVSTVGKRGAAVKLGLFQLLFNLAAVLIALPLIQPLIAAATSFGSDPGRHIANAHVIFNVLSVLLALPLVRPIARLFDRVVPERDEGALPSEGEAS